MAGRHGTSVCAAAVQQGSRQAAGLRKSACSPIAGLHPLRLLSTVVQEQLAIAQMQGANTGKHDSFVGSDQHRQLSTLRAHTDPEAQVLQQGSAEWHSARRQRVTASSVARATGLLPMCDPLTPCVLWAPSQTTRGTEPSHAAVDLALNRFMLLACHQTIAPRPVLGSAVHALLEEAK